MARSQPHAILSRKRRHHRCVPATRTRRQAIPAYVFGYGALVAQRAPGQALHTLRGVERRWQVAMDNRLDLPGYKYYVEPCTGVRPDVSVTFLDLARRPGGAVDGVLLEVDDGALARLDARERSYRRVQVSAHVTPQPAGPVHVYVGSRAARRRFAEALEQSRAVIDAGYADAVEAAFRSAGADALARFRRSTRPPPCPRRRLRRIDLP
jgi:cation transport regulator ChaC